MSYFFSSLFISKSAFAWVQCFIRHLALIEADFVDYMVALLGQLFYSTHIPQLSLDVRMQQFAL
jgi:hypothetical protein